MNKKLKTPRIQKLDLDICFLEEIINEVKKNIIKFSISKPNSMAIEDDIRWLAEL